MISKFAVFSKKTTAFVSSEMNCFELSLTKLNSRVSAGLRIMQAELLPSTGFGKSVGFGVGIGTGGATEIPCAIFSMNSSLVSFSSNGLT